MDKRSLVVMAGGARRRLLQSGFAFSKGVTRAGGVDSACRDSKARRVEKPLPLGRDAMSWGGAGQGVCGRRRKKGGGRHAPPGARRREKKVGKVLWSSRHADPAPLSLTMHTHSVVRARKMPRRLDAKSVNTSSGKRMVIG